MGTVLYILLIGAAVVVVMGLLVQLVGTFLFGALTVAVGVRDLWANKWGPYEAKQDASR